MALVSQIVTVGRAALGESPGRVSPAQLHLLFAGVDVVFGR